MPATSTSRKPSGSTKKAQAARKPSAKSAARSVRAPSPVGITQIVREALMEALSVVVRAAQRALAAAREVGALALHAARQLIAGTSAGLGEAFRGHTTKRRAA